MATATARKSSSNSTPDSTPSEDVPMPTPPAAPIDEHKVEGVLHKPRPEGLVMPTSTRGATSEFAALMATAIAATRQDPSYFTVTSISRGDQSEEIYNKAVTAYTAKLRNNAARFEYAPKVPWNVSFKSIPAHLQDTYGGTHAWQLVPDTKKLAKVQTESEATES